MLRSAVALPGRLGGLVMRHVRVNRVPHLVYRMAPGIGRTMVRLWYQYISRFDRKQQMLFMNYGYAGLDSAATVELQPGDEVNRYSIQLYHHVAGGADLRGKDVLEIGCGRGGGAAYVARYLGAGSVTGVDIAAKAVEFCQRHYSVANLGFRQGDAEALPFEDSSFDAVLNVESSPCYPSMEKFLSEVRRVLRPGGVFLYADFRDRGGAGQVRSSMEGAGFEVRREECITRNILRALELDSDRKAALIRQRVPWFARHVFREFASVAGTATYEAFRRGQWEYFSFLLCRNGSV